MHWKWKCPHCHAPLAQQARGLQCSTHGDYLEDAQQVLHFLAEDANYFTEHWRTSQLPTLPASKLAAAEQFLKPLTGKLQEGQVLDVGAGDGVHLSYLSKATPRLALAGLDISIPALIASRSRVPSATLMHAAAQRIPLADASLDGCFSYGVLAYLPDPWQGLAEMVRATKQGGLIGIWMYPKRSDLMGRVFHAVRRIVPQLPRFLQHRVADGIVPLLRWLPTASGMHLGNASWRSCREVVLVNIAPPHLLFPTVEEVERRLEALGCRIFSEDASMPICLWAIKG